jgi:putative hemolysin
MAGVVDEHGAFGGIVTMEDLIEVIVGEIDDERGQPQPRVVRLPDGAIETEGSVPVFELNQEYGLRLPESSDYVTVAGLLLARLGLIPRGGESVDVPPHRLNVTRVEGNRIARVRVEPLTTG